jgi:hypothetical protein
MDKDSLIAWLQKHPGNPKIMLASDAEGNRFALLEEPCEGFFPKGYLGGETEEVFVKTDLVDETDPDEAVLDDFETTIILWPQH